MATGNLKGMNVVLFVTDQERAIQHFPEGWAKKNLPGATYLAENGLTFNRAFCHAADRKLPRAARREVDP
jgi:arylsulfatase A-like enzyme